MSYQGSDVHFFKRIEEDTLRTGELRIPRSFVNKYWEGISNPINLILSNGVKWDVNWKKHDADIWLIDNWKKFAKFYSLDQDHLLVFRYVGKSKFQVVIFDQNCLEMEYPSMEGTSDGEENVNFISQSKRVKSPLPCSHSTKKVKTKHTQSQKTMVHGEDFDDSKPQKRGRRRIMYANTKRRCSKSKAIQNELLKDTESSTAFERANAFRSDNPFFIRQMHPSYIKKYFMTMPGGFITEDQQKEVECITLWIFERNWDVKFYPNLSSAQILLSSGWMDFVKDNELKIGDVCVFEQIKKPGVSFRVIIYRDGEESNTSMVSAHENEANRSKQTGHGNIFARRGSDEIPKKCSGNNVFNDSEFHIFNNKISDNHFTFSVKPNEFYCKTIPKNFIRNHGIDNINDVTLRVGNRSWHVKLDGQGRFTSGWSVFLSQCNLKARDVCNFELIDKKEVVFQVTITKFIN